MSFSYKNIRLIASLCAILTLCFLLASCSSGSSVDVPDAKSLDSEIDEYLKSKGEPEIPLAAEATGEQVSENESGIIDFSNTSDGYVMAKFTRETEKALRVQISGPQTVYTYTLNVGEWNVFPLSDGNGEYTATLYENVTDNKYAAALSASFSVNVSKDTASYLRPNQYVNYTDSPRSLAAAELLCGDTSGTLEKVEAVYSFVVKNFRYDYDKAASVEYGYLPVLDEILAARKGICFDYAAVMAGMLRSQGVPCKLVTGYAKDVFHAWISVWVDSEGWIEKVIYFDGKNWQMMDPTFASNTSTKSVSKLMADGETYQAMYFY